MAELRWYDFRGPSGTITIKATSETAAREEAAERWRCDEEEIVCTGHTKFFGGRRLW